MKISPNNYIDLEVEIQDMSISNGLTPSPVLIKESLGKDYLQDGMTGHYMTTLEANTRYHQSITKDSGKYSRTRYGDKQMARSSLP